MKYLKLFEDHKQTSDKVSGIQKEADDKIMAALEDYRYMINQFMFDITDEYDTSSEIRIVDADRSYGSTKTYVHYTIQFRADEYETFLTKLEEVIERITKSEDITYYISRVYVVIDDGGEHIPGRFSNLRYPFDIIECKTKIRNYIRDNFNNYAGDRKMKIKISF